MAAQIGSEFINFYYSVYDSDRSKLNNLFVNESQLTFANAEFRGTEQIIGKINSLPATKHKISSQSFQTLANDGILVFVTGGILLEGESRELPFSEIFTLYKLNNSYVIANNIFNLATI